MTPDEWPPRYQDYLHGVGPPQPVPERVPDPHYRSTVFITLDDEVATAARLAEDGWEWDGPPPKRVWLAIDQGEFEELAEFEGTREEAIEWALKRPNVREIRVYSEETRTMEPLSRPD